MKETEISDLREQIVSRLGERRAEHVLSTEKEAARLAGIYLPNRIDKVRIAALLHDITKEYDEKKQLQIFAEFGIIVDNVSMRSPKVFHSHTAALLIPREFAEFADAEIISAVDKHTAGSDDMSVFDCIIYLADYIEPLRKFDDCRKLREYFWGGMKSGATNSDMTKHLYKTMIMSFDLTINNLISEKSVIDKNTVAARNSFLLKLAEITEDFENE